VFLALIKELGWDGDLAALLPGLPDASRLLVERSAAP